MAEENKVPVKVTPVVPETPAVPEVLEAKEDENLIDVSEDISELFDDELEEEGKVETPPAAEEVPPGDKVPAKPETPPEPEVPAAEVPADELPPATGVPPKGDETPPVETPPATEVDPIKKLEEQNAKLLKLVNDLSVGGPVKTPAAETPATPATPATPEVPAVPEKVIGEIKPEDLLPDLNQIFENLDFDKVMENKENFKEFFLKSMSIVQQDTAQKVMTSMPKIVGSYVQRSAVMKDVAKSFYGKYPELKPVKGYVAKVSDAVAAENPEWEIGKVLEEAAQRTSKALDIVIGVKKEEEKLPPGTPKKETTPALPGGGRTPRTPMKPSEGLQSEIDELIDD